MIHFFFTYTDDASGTPFAKALRDQQVPYAMFSRRVDLGYRHRIQLLLVGLPNLLLYSLRSAVWSFFGGAPKADAAVVGSHMQALVFWLCRAIVRRPVKIVLTGFIYTQRRQRWLQSLRRRYFQWLFERIDGVLCHSELEVARYGAEFGTPAKFKFVPFGLNVTGHEEAPEFIRPGSGRALTAGRSGRDYATLLTAFGALGHPLDVVCDVHSALSGIDVPANVAVLTDCYGDRYFEQLRRCDMVVVALGVSDISAGQMVVIQAMALRKPIIVTRMPTLQHYVRDGWNALLVEPGDSASIVAAVRRLCADEDLARHLAANAYATFVDAFSIPAFVRQTVEATDAF